eukprot:gene22103-29161_t
MATGSQDRASTHLSAMPSNTTTSKQSSSTRSPPRANLSGWAGLGGLGSHNISPSLPGKKMRRFSSWRRASAVFSTGMVWDAALVVDRCTPKTALQTYRELAATLWRAKENGQAFKIPLSPESEDFDMEIPQDGPLGTALLLSFARLYLIRQETQMITLTQYILESWMPSEVFIRAAYTGLMSCLELYYDAKLTKDEVKGFKGMMGFFLERAIPTLRDHYAQLPAPRGRPSATFLLLEMVGWAYTWDPKAPIPIDSLTPHLDAAAEKRLKDLPTLHTSVNIQDLLQLSTSVESARNDLQRDMMTKVHIANLETKVIENDLQRDMMTKVHIANLETKVIEWTQNRFTSICACLDQMFTLEPGKDNNCRKIVWELEEEIQSYNAALVRFGICRALPAPGEGNVPLTLSISEVATDSDDDTGALNLYCYDAEPAIIEVMSRWIEASAIDMAAHFWRFVGAEKWKVNSDEVSLCLAWIEASAIDMAAHFRRLVGAEKWKVTSDEVSLCLAQMRHPLNAAIDAWVEKGHAGSDARRITLRDLIIKWVHYVFTQFASDLVDAFFVEMRCLNQASNAPTPETAKGVRGKSTLDKSIRWGSFTANEPPLTKTPPSATKSILKGTPSFKWSTLSGEASLKSDISEIVTPTASVSTRATDPSFVSDCVLDVFGARNHKAKEYQAGDEQEIMKRLESVESICLNEAACAICNTLDQMVSLRMNSMQQQQAMDGLMGRRRSVEPQLECIDSGEPEQGGRGGSSPYQYDSGQVTSRKEAAPRLKFDHADMMTTWANSSKDSDEETDDEGEELVESRDSYPAVPYTTVSVQGFLIYTNTMYQRDIADDNSSSYTDIFPPASNQADLIPNLGAAPNVEEPLDSKMIVVSVFTARWKELEASVNGFRKEMLTEYYHQYRVTLSKMITSAYGRQPPSAKILSGILTCISGELACMGKYSGAAEETEEIETVEDFVRIDAVTTSRALLQALQASTVDLTEMFEAQLRCRQLMPISDGHVWELSPQQLSLLNILRMLRQRCKTDSLARDFVSDQLKLAGALAAQFIFGLSASERVSTEARCSFGSSSRSVGRLYITQHCVSFTTVLESDLNKATDRTLCLEIDRIKLRSEENEFYIDKISFCYEGEDFEVLAVLQEAEAQRLNQQQQPQQQQQEQDQSEALGSSQTLPTKASQSQSAILPSGSARSSPCSPASSARTLPTPSVNLADKAMQLNGPAGSSLVYMTPTKLSRLGLSGAKSELLSRQSSPWRRDAAGSSLLSGAKNEPGCPQSLPTSNDTLGSSLVYGAKSELASRLSSPWRRDAAGSSLRSVFGRSSSQMESSSMVWPTTSATVTATASSSTCVSTRASKSSTPLKVASDPASGSRNSSQPQVCVSGGGGGVGLPSGSSILLGRVSASIQARPSNQAVVGHLLTPHSLSQQGSDYRLKSVRLSMRLSGQQRSASGLLKSRESQQIVGGGESLQTQLSHQGSEVRVSRTSDRSSGGDRQLPNRTSPGVSGRVGRTSDRSSGGERQLPTRTSPGVSGRMSRTSDRSRGGDRQLTTRASLGVSGRMSRTSDRSSGGDGQLFTRSSLPVLGSQTSTACPPVHRISGGAGAGPLFGLENCEVLFWLMGGLETIVSGHPELSSSAMARIDSDASPTRSSRPGVESADLPPSSCKQVIADLLPSSLKQVSVLSVPCYLMGTLKRFNGSLELFSDRLDFFLDSKVLHKSISLEDVSNITQRQFIINGVVLRVKVLGESSPYLFGGMSNAVLTALKQSISDGYTAHSIAAAASPVMSASMSMSFRSVPVTSRLESASFPVPPPFKLRLRVAASINESPLTSSSSLLSHHHSRPAHASKLALRIGRSKTHLSAPIKPIRLSTSICATNAPEISTGSGGGDDQQGGGGGGGGDGDGGDDEEWGEDSDQEPEQVVTLKELQLFAQEKNIKIPKEMLQVASKYGIRLAVVKNYVDLKDKFLIGFIVQNVPFFRNRILADPLFFAKVGMEVGIDSCCTTLAETRKRGKNQRNILALNPAKHNCTESGGTFLH